MTTAAEPTNLIWVFRVIAKNHDRGSPEASFLRETREIAERSADLMRQCGYGEVKVVPFLMNPDESIGIEVEELKRIQRALMS